MVFSVVESLFFEQVVVIMRIAVSYSTKLHKKFAYRTLKMTFLRSYPQKKLLGVCEDGMGKQHGTRRDSNNY